MNTAIRNSLLSALLIFMIVAHPPAKHKQVSCLVIASYVWMYGEDAAIQWALKHGYSQAAIEEAKARCKKVGVI